MSYQNIDVPLSPTEVKAIKDAFETVLKKSRFWSIWRPTSARSSSRPGPIAYPSSKMPCQGRRQDHARAEADSRATGRTLQASAQEEAARPARGM